MLNSNFISPTPHSLFFTGMRKAAEGHPEPKFSTECFFLTLHCHHLAILPVTRKYQRRLRAIRDLHRLITEIEATEEHWKNLPMASRSREQLRKWKSQYQVRGQDHLFDWIVCWAG